MSARMCRMRFVVLLVKTRLQFGSARLFSCSCATSSASSCTACTGGLILWQNRCVLPSQGVADAQHCLIRAALSSLRPVVSFMLISSQMRHMSTASVSLSHWSVRHQLSKRDSREQRKCPVPRCGATTFPSVDVLLCRSMFCSVRFLHFELLPSMLEWLGCLRK